MAEPLLAVFSDIHSNLEAFEAVLSDMNAAGVNQYICLGDIVGYAANPRECVELVRGLDCAVLQGNHDAAAAGELTRNAMREAARASIEFSRSSLSDEQREYLADLPLELTLEQNQFVHASLEAPGEWIYVLRSGDAEAHFDVQEHPLCFCGHTHVPAVWHPSSDGMLTYRAAGRVRLPPEGKVLVNVGSVGQPRDSIPFACYAIYDRRACAVEFRRVAYDVKKAGEKILAAGLPASLAERLISGK